MLETVALVGLGLAGLTGWRARGREARIAARFPALGPVVTVEGRRLHLWQTGAGPDLVMIHGASANLRELQALAEALAAQFRVTLIDRPGLGWSAPGVDDPREQARLMRLAAEGLGVRHPLLLGHSYGGAVALAWAMQAPVAGLALISGVAMPWPGGLGAWYAATKPAPLRALLVPLVAAHVPRRRIEAAMTEVFAPQPCPPGYGQAAGVPLILRRAALAANARQINSLLPVVRVMAGQYDTIQSPVEIVHGTSDTIVPAAIHALPLSQRLPDARLTLIEGAGHMPHRTHEAEIRAAVIRLAGRAGLRLDCRQDDEGSQ
ncbi:alpha/beta fold hydrolase [Gemmobacter caeruleus]|uniref:alpha/beta fold hydrolase n=1 Tax=Gemmobacter caeruleus TaxID=2595004 RepID=UPI0011EF1C8D|nr:alpha/beta hydrolase [Gemmobacter caeruleus]